jgi:hypothetical protein
MAQNNRSFESTLHDIVYSIDTGTGLKIIRVMLYLLLLLLIVMIYTATQFRGLKSAEAMDYAQLGRNLSKEGGLVTKCVRPVSMWKMSQRNPRENPQIAGHPDLFHPPAYPAALAAGYKLFEVVGADPFAVPESRRKASIMPAEQWVVLPLNHIFSMLTGGLVFLLGRRLFSREIGFLGMTIYYLSNLVWQDSISGLNISMATFLVVASFYTMVVAMLSRYNGEPMKKWLVPFLCSVGFASAAFLTRYIAAAAVPGIVLFTWLMGGRFRGGTRLAVVFVLLFSLLISPWLYRNYKISGNPIGMAAHSALAGSEKYPDRQFDRQLEPKFSWGEFNSELKAKWVSNFSTSQPAVLSGMGGGVLMAMFIVTFFYHFVRPQVNYLRWGLGLSLILMLSIGGFFAESSIRMIHVFWPFVILYGLAFFYILIDRLDLGVRLYNVGLKVLIVLLSAMPLILTIIPPHNNNNPYPPYHALIISRVSGWLTPREVMMTDMPWATAWYGDRVSIMLPKDLDDFYAINDYKQYISGMYVTMLTRNKPFVSGLIHGPEQSWSSILLSGRLPPDFPLKKFTQISGLDQMFFSDRVRWSGQ